MGRLREEYERTGRGEVFHRLKVALDGGPEAVSYAVIGADLDMSEQAVQAAVYRLRRRYRALLARRNRNDRGRADRRRGRNPRSVHFAQILKTFRVIFCLQMVMDETDSLPRRFPGDDRREPMSEVRW